MIVMTDFEEVQEVFDSATEISVYDNGNKASFESGSENFQKILTAWQQQIKGSRQMPAYGVSLDNYTRKEMLKGLWVEFTFGKVLECNQMPFEKLLINVQKENQGLNLIRYLKKKGYDGRCFYLDFDNRDMSEFYAVISKIV